MRRIFSLILVLAAILTPAAVGQSVYVIGDEGSFGSFDLITLEYNRIDPVAGSGYGNLTSAGDGTFYTTTSRINDSDIARISMDGALSAPGNGSLSYLAGLARSPGGTLYGADYYNYNLVSINPVSGTQTTVGGIGFRSANAPGTLAYAGGSLYAFGNDVNAPAGPQGGLYQVNTGTGSYGARIGPADNVYAGMRAFGIESDLYGLNGSSVYRINTSSGIPVLIGTLTGSNVPGGFMGAFAVVPEPGSVLCVVLAGLGLAARRRRNV